MQGSGAAGGNTRPARTCRATSGARARRQASPRSPVAGNYVGHVVGELARRLLVDPGRAVRPDRRRVVVGETVVSNLAAVGEGHPGVRGDLRRQAPRDPDEVDRKQNDEEGVLLEPRREYAETARRQPARVSTAQSWDDASRRR